MGVRPSQENWKLAQLFSLTSHSRIKDKPKKVITVVRSLNCSTKTLVAFCSFLFSVLFFSFHFCSFLFLQANHHTTTSKYIAKEAVAPS